MKVAAIVRSIRKDSYNLKLARYIQNRYQHLFQVGCAEHSGSPLLRSGYRVRSTAAGY